MNNPDLDRLFENIVQFSLTNNGDKSFYELELTKDKKWNLVTLFGEHLDIPKELNKCNNKTEVIHILKRIYPNIHIY